MTSSWPVKERATQLIHEMFWQLVVCGNYWAENVIYFLIIPTANWPRWNGMFFHTKMSFLHVMTTSYQNNLFSFWYTKIWNKWKKVKLFLNMMLYQNDCHFAGETFLKCIDLKEFVLWFDFNFTDMCSQVKWSISQHSFRYRTGDKQQSLTPNNVEHLPFKDVLCLPLKLM